MNATVWLIAGTAAGTVIVIFVSVLIVYFCWWRPKLKAKLASKKKPSPTSACVGVQPASAVQIELAPGPDQGQSEGAPPTHSVAPAPTEPITPQLPPTTSLEPVKETGAPEVPEPAKQVDLSNLRRKSSVDRTQTTAEHGTEDKETSTDSDNPQAAKGTGTSHPNIPNGTKVDSRQQKLKKKKKTKGAWRKAWRKKRKSDTVPTTATEDEKTSGQKKCRLLSQTSQSTEPAKGSKDSKSDASEQLKMLTESAMDCMSRHKLWEELKGKRFGTANPPDAIRDRPTEFHLAMRHYANEIVHDAEPDEYCLINGFVSDTLKVIDAKIESGTALFESTGLEATPDGRSVFAATLRTHLRLKTTPHWQTMLAFALEYGHLVPVAPDTQHRLASYSIPLLLVIAFRQARGKLMRARALAVLKRKVKRVMGLSNETQLLQAPYPVHLIPEALKRKPDFLANLHLVLSDSPPPNSEEEPQPEHSAPAKSKESRRERERRLIAKAKRKRRELTEKSEVTSGALTEGNQISEGEGMKPRAMDAKKVEESRK